ncbi:MAG: M1 family metallopeptidase, partial [Candidatus Saccharimonadales bacterium]
PMEGLYPCFYDNANGTQEIILATQFESHHAREVFPCIDEPEAKAVFELSLINEKDLSVLANTEINKTIERPDGLLEYVFEPTPKMSTYLLAFVIGKLDYLESSTEAGVKVRTYSRPDLVKNTAFALETATRCLNFYNQYFDIDYPLSKCDLVALPDFASGAMENWGLITFREQGLIVDPDNTSLSMKQYVADVIAHELTHQWFGNLVTMRWWNDLWLNESFASLMSYVALDALFPHWQPWVQFIVAEQSTALKMDSLEHTHPINVVIRHPDEIRTIFDNISYEKGASVLFMLMRYLGDEDFKNGLRHYLKKHSYSNTESSDLWQAWEETAKKPIADFMASWTTQSGYPLIKAEVHDLDTDLTQARFYISPHAKREETLWPVPLIPNLELSQEVLNQPQQTLSLKSTVKHSPLVLNHGRSAFCRVVYDNSHLLKLTALVKSRELEPLDRLGLLSDYFEAAKAGLINTVEALELLRAYSDEDNVVVWDIIASNLARVRSVVIENDEDLRRAMNPSVRELIAKQYARLGWDSKTSDTHFDKLLRPLILGLACMSDDPVALKEVETRFKQRSKKPIHPDIRALIYQTIARGGDNAEFDTFLEMHDQSESSEERLALASALTNFKQQELIERSLKLITAETVRLQDVAYWIGYGFSNRFGKIATWEWLKKNWDWLEKNLGTDLSFSHMPTYAARAFSDLLFLPEFEAFFRSKLTASFERPLNQAIETITWQALWRERDKAKVANYYLKRSK